jgi:hypothetical protein
VNHSEQINELAAALAVAQGKFQPIKRSKTVEVTGKTKDGRDFKYKYAYAPLDEILNATRPALSENGLALTQTTDEEDRGTMLKTMLVHSSGQWMASFKSLGRLEDPQKFGGALTYYRRYEISAILGISSEEDDDANGVVGNEVKRKTPERRPDVNPETGEVTQLKQDSRSTPPAKQEPAKPNGNGGNGHKQADTTTLFWKTAREMELTKEKAQAILAAAGNDFAVALDRLTGNSQPPVEA